MLRRQRRRSTAFIAAARAAIPDTAQSLSELHIFFYRIKTQYQTPVPNFCRRNPLISARKAAVWDISRRPSYRGLPIPVRPTNPLYMHILRLSFLRPRIRSICKMFERHILILSFGGQLRLRRRKLSVIPTLSVYVSVCRKLSFSPCRSASRSLYKKTPPHVVSTCGGCAVTDALIVPCSNCHPI